MDNIEARRAWVLSDLMVESAGGNLYTTVLIADLDRKIIDLTKGWAGGKQKGRSSDEFISRLEAMELLTDLPETGCVRMTPTENKLGCGQKGGVAYNSGKAVFITSASGWSEGCNRMISLLLNYATINEMTFHHVGFRHQSRASLQEAIAADEERHGEKAIPVPAEDHERYYTRVATSKSKNITYWIEHQFFPSILDSSAIHWDVVTQNPASLLNFLATNLGTKANRWDVGPNDPIGAVWQKNIDGVEYGIMARREWWNI